MRSGRRQVSTHEVDSDAGGARMRATGAGVMIGPLSLAEDDALRAAVAPHRDANVEVADELIRALAGVLDIREVFPQVSEIARQALPHDRLTMTFHDKLGGSIVMHAASNGDGPTAVRATPADPATFAAGSFKIIDDLRAHKPDVIYDPPDHRQRVVAAGYRSVLAVCLAARDQQFGLQFWSKQLKAFRYGQVSIARRIAEYVALAVSHQQLAEAVSRAAEAHARAEQLEARVRSLTAELDSRGGYGRVIGHSHTWTAALKSATQVASTETTVLLTGE